MVRLVLGMFFFFQPTTHRDCGSIRWMRCVSFFPEGQGFGEEVFFHLGCPGSFQGIPRTPEALNEPLSPLPRAVLRGAPWLEPFTRGLGPNKYPCDKYKVYMGLIIEGTIPRIPPFSLWTIVFLEMRGWWSNDGWISGSWWGFLFWCFHYHKRVQ